VQAETDTPSRAITESVSISAAGRRLGLTVEATRMRARRGHLPAHKGAGGRWYVGPEVAQGADPHTGQTVQGATPTPDATVANALATTDVIRLQLDALTAQLSVEDQSLADRAREIEQLHVLLRTSQQNEQRLLAATIPDAEDQSPAERPTTPRRGAERETGASEGQPRRGWSGGREGDDRHDD
jgi:hypothetical protein